MSVRFPQFELRKSFCIDNTCVCDVNCASPLNMDTRILRTVLRVPLVSVLTGFHCNSLEIAESLSGF